MSFNILKEEVENGILGRNKMIPMGFHRLNKYIGIRKRVMTMVFGSPGSGKSAFVHSAYILHPFDYLQRTNSNIRFKVIFFSMERSKVYIIAKWVSRRIFLETGNYIPIQKLLGWWGDKYKLTHDEHDLFLSTEEYINTLLQTVDIIDGAQNPTGIFKYVKKYAEENGRFEQISEYEKVYLPNDPFEVVIVIEDHLGITKLEKGYSTKKEAIDKLTEYNQYFRDTLGYTIVTVSQITRALSNPIFQKKDSIEPSIDDIKESGNPGEASDVVLSLFDPVRYKTEDFSYRDVLKFVDPTNGGSYFRSSKILKNSYGEDSIRVGLAFFGGTGMFKELPKSTEMQGFDYNELFNHTYFLDNE